MSDCQVAGAGSSTYASPVDAHVADGPAEDAPPRESASASGLLRRVTRFLRRLGPAGALLVGASSLPTIGAAALLGVIAFVAPALRQSAWAPLVCVVAFTALGGLSLLPTYALSIVAGWCFGFAIGFPTALAGIVGAAMVAYLVARRASGQRLLAIIDEKPTWRAVHHALLGGGFWRAVWIISLLRLAPFPPFAITNLVMGAAHVRLSRFFTGTLFGMAPHAAVLVLAAVGLQQVSFRAGEQPVLIVAGIGAMIAVVVVIGRLARRALEQVAREEEAAEEPARTTTVSPHAAAERSE
jgi:uncharacterized membrane protein YdjX (TVP38/TMEM64 family)